MHNPFGLQKHPFEGSVTTLEVESIEVIFYSSITICLSKLCLSLADINIPSAYNVTSLGLFWTYLYIISHISSIHTIKSFVLLYSCGYHGYFKSGDQFHCFGYFFMGCTFLFISPKSLWIFFDIFCSIFANALR